VAYDWNTELPGVFSRHADNCPVRDGGECTCGPLGYRASVREWDSNRRTISPTFENIQEATAWQRDQTARQDAARGLAADRGELGALIDEFLQAAEDGTVRDGSGNPYTRDGVRALRGALSYVDSELGTMDVQDVRRRHIQSLLDQLLTAGLAPARINGVAAALDSLYGYAIQRELVGFSPVVSLRLPQSENGVAHAVPSPARAAAAAEDRSHPPRVPTAPTSGGADPWTPPTFPPPESPASGGSPPETGYAAPSGAATEATPQERPAAPPGPYPTPPPPHATPPPPYATPPPWPYATSPWPYPTPPPYATPPGPYATPPGPYTTAPGAYTTPPDAYTTPPPYQQQSPEGHTSGIANAIFGSPGTAPDANYDATMQERWLWWTVRIIVIVFVLIALVLVAESV
jgi:nitroreductase